MSQTVTETMSPVMRRVRAYAAPVSRSTATADLPAIFDPAQSATFDLNQPPAPWMDLGWIDGFARTCGTKIVPLRAGAPAATQMQVRTETDATVQFGFAAWGKLQLALSCGTQQMNVLETGAGAPAQGSGGVAVGAIALQAGSTASLLNVGATAAAGFAVGQLVAVDLDYAGQTGFVGSGFAGAFVRSALSDTDYVRRVTLNVGRIVSIANGALALEAPLPAGIPGAAMKMSGVVGFCDREGSSFFQEWSGLFIGEGQQCERVVWHYPRLQSAAGIAENTTANSGFNKLRLRGSFRALPVVDPVDGETVVCFRSYVAA